MKYRGHLVYVYDAYCGWCYGFTPWLRKALAERPYLTVEVVSGGLFTGDRRVPIRRLDHIPLARHRVTAVTGAEFGPAFLDILDRGEFVMDSEDAATGLAGLRALDPDRVVEFAGELSRAFYHDGLSLSDPDTYRLIAARHGLDAQRAAAALTDPGYRAYASSEFARAAGLGVTSYPTLLLDAGNGLRRLDSALAAPRNLGQVLDQALVPARIA